MSKGTVIRPTFEMLFSTAMLAAFIWSVRFLLPKAKREHDAFALTSAVLTALFALLLWLFVGVGTQSSASASS